MGEFLFQSRSPAATYNLGKKLGRKMEAGSILALIGELGCGKTLLTRGICAGLDLPVKYVSSPTFVFVNEYRGKYPVYHMDLYRLGDIEEGFGIGILDYLSKAEYGIIIVEWAEKILSLLPDDYLKVQFEVLSAKERRIMINGGGAGYEKLLKGIGGK